MCLSRTVEVVPVVVDDDFFPFVVPPKVCRPFALTTKRNTRVVRAEEREEEEEEEEAPEEKRRRARFDTEEELLRGETTFARACCAVPVVGETGGVTPMVSKANKKEWRHSLLRFMGKEREKRERETHTCDVLIKY